ncbi:uncharacterized protein LOC110612436 isoform X2 [Manihot esculenta]|uniref:DUF547 domain-containing protein n=3 Tax=Manihot esculenta TaxID=3983 RepID=A0A2C9W4R5_MANES|nr:uncharacterized protein LOC110612436 isoform X2 [Manihot esculenta]OAY54175.1 hypothetical protein MANES_03G054600v8 [Manihot esculenta]
MLCLKAEVLDDHDLNSSSISTNSNNGGGGGFGFILPMNLGSSIHKYLWRNGRFSNRSVSSGDGYPPSISDFEDIKTPEKRSGQLKFGNMSLYKCQLEEDVKKLQEQLQEEIELRLALASAVEHSDSSISSSPCQLPDKAQELLDSIAILEITVSKLEQEAIALQYQLSQEKNERHLAEWRLRRLACRTSPPLDSSHTCLTELIRRPSCGDNVEGKVEDKPPWDDANKLNRVHFVEKLWHYPNRLSEEMVWCMRDIFVFLADSSKPSSSECMASPSSPQGHLSYSSLASFSESPTMNSYRKSPSVDMEQGSEVSPRYCKIDPYIIPGKVDWIQGIGAYSTAVEVSWLSVGKKELEYASGALKRFRLLVEQLAEVDPSCLSCTEKLAFWINVYNALIMHAFLAYGVPRSDIKLFSLMQKAAYTIGGHTFSAADIEFVILRMKPPAHRPQIALLLALQKFKVSEDQKFSIDLPEPLLAFALSCGMHSSPAVRIFKPENVTELLKTSLKDYVQASVGISSKGKLLVPKLLYCFAKGIVDDLQLPEWICQFLNPEQASMVKDISSKHKWRLLGARSFSVIPFDSRFRFLFIL